MKLENIEKPKGRTFCMGDLHGSYRAMKQVFERAGFNEEDTLIQLGDVVDGWSEVYECVEELIGIKNLISIKGNHDQWFLEFIETRKHGSQWKQGADSTLKSYLTKAGKEEYYEMINWGHDYLFDERDIPALHKKFFEDQIIYHIDDKNRLFVHAGFNRHYNLEQTPAYLMYWDRDLWSSALSWESMRDEDKEKYKFKTKDNFTEVYIGHTTTNHWKKDVPMKAAMLWNLDTGAGWSGKLSMMDIDTKEVFQSDNVLELYPNEAGRRGSK